MIHILNKGDRFGKLTVVERVEDTFGNNGAKYPQYLCKCDCGGEKTVREAYLKNGYTKSCGCLKLCHEKKPRGKREPNYFYIIDDIVCVKLSNCDKYMLCDRSIWKEAGKYTWRLDDHGYASASIYGKTVRFHSYFYGKQDFVIDHIDRDKLNNMSANLRNVDRRTNNQNVDIRSNNSTGYIGVSYDKRRDKFYSYINYESRKRKFLGYFNTAVEASKAREQAELIYY